MLSYKIYSREIKGGALMLRLTNNRKSTEISIGIKMPQLELDKILSHAPGVTNITQQKYIQTILTKLEGIKLTLNETGRRNEDVKTIRKIVEASIFGIESCPEDNRVDFVKYFLGVGETKAKATADSFAYTVSTMRKYDGRVDELKLEDITYAWLSDFEVWMKKRGLSQNTRKIHFGNIRIAMREAYKRELTENDPFRRFSFRPEKTRKRSMAVESLRNLFNYPVEPFAEFYRDMFKLIFMLCGINLVDLHRLKAISDDGRIEYKRAKTGRLYSIKVEPEALAIIEKYRGEKGLLCAADRWSDHKNFGHQLNAAISRIGKAQGKGIKDKEEDGPFAEVTSYWARHTWATIAADLDIPDATISLALGHSGENRVTDIYIRRNQKKVDEANRKVLDWVLYGKK